MLAMILAALAAPPSSHLKGASGELVWEIEARDGGVHVEGRSPKWRVVHEAAADLSPRHTERTVDGQTTVVDYTAQGATVTFPGGRTVVIETPGIWDGDTLDVRLGQAYADGRPAQVFKAVDTASGKVYRFDSQLVGPDQCGAQACGHVLVQLTGMLRALGPSFHYWFAADGRLLRFEGPAGEFRAE
ncbi:MAG: hypothetical protein H6737_30090 [Alphaproteobacteria bacterium]|nr:hypothetical protein [Alphaproteobacteria bacterium]